MALRNAVISNAVNPNTGNNTQKQSLSICICVCARQKLEPSRPMDVAHRTLHRLDKVSTKRGMFEKDSQAAAPTSPKPSRHVKHSVSTRSFSHFNVDNQRCNSSHCYTTLFFQEMKSFSTGVSVRINRWVSKAKDQTITSQGAAVSSNYRCATPEGAVVCECKSLQGRSLNLG